MALKLIRMLNRLSAGGNHVIDHVTSRGDHSVHPPLDELRLLVENWLCQLLPDDQPITCELKVECRRDACSRQFQGVKAICVPDFNASATTIELRARPRGSTCQWICFLICESQTIAVNIICKARPSACTYLVERYKADVRKTSKQPLGHASKRKADADSVHLNRFLHQLKRRTTLRQLCGSLHSNQQLDKIPRGSICQALSSILGSKTITAESMCSLLEHLVEAGVLDPLSESHFSRTMLFDEYSNEYLQQMKQGLQIQLEQDRDANERALEYCRREGQRLKMQVDANKELERSLFQRQDEIKNQLSE